MTVWETFGQLLRSGEAWHLVGPRFDAKAPALVLKMIEAQDLWSEESGRVGTQVICHGDVKPMRRRHILHLFGKESLITDCP